MTIFLVAILTVMLASALARTATDRQVADSGQNAVRALTVAESGLNRYLDTVTVRPSDGDSGAAPNVPGGSAYIGVTVLHNPADTMLNWMYAIRSTGYAIDPNTWPVPLGQRTIARLAYWQTGQINRIAAFVPANGLTTPVADGIRIRGADQCAGAEPSISGVLTPTGPWPVGDITGTPAIHPWNTPQDVALGTGVDWSRMRSGDFRYDYTSMVNPLTWSAYFIDGDLTLTAAQGNGLLVVTGNLTTSGSRIEWWGIVLVGGQISFGLHTDVYGLVISGLDAQIPSLPAVPANTIGGADRYHIDYNSCSVASALQNLTGLVPIQTAWLDNWATY